MDTNFKLEQCICSYCHHSPLKSFKFQIYIRQCVLFQIFFIHFADLQCTVSVYKLQACSVMFTDAAALLFQSAERALIDVKSIHVATNEMEEILQLLTERDIEHTNNLPLLPVPTHTLLSPDVLSGRCCQYFSVCLCISLYHPVCSSTKPSHAGKFLISILIFLLITTELLKLSFEGSSSAFIS